MSRIVARACTTLNLFRAIAHWRQEVAMGLFDKIDRHADLVKRMAETVHVDFSDAMERGELSGEDVRRAVFTCMSCASADECPHWMDEHTDGSAAAPEYCRNRGLLARLAR